MHAWLFFFLRRMSEDDILEFELEFDEVFFRAIAEHLDFLLLVRALTGVVGIEAQLVRCALTFIIVVILLFSFAFERRGR